MDWQTITYRQDGAVAVITANRPQALNAQSRVMIGEITAALRHAGDDDSVRVVVVAAAEAATGSEQNGISEPGSMPTSHWRINRASTTLQNPSSFTSHAATLSQPISAGAGSTACDIIIAAPTARLPAFALTDRQPSRTMPVSGPRPQH